MLRLALAGLPRILAKPDADLCAILRGGIEQQSLDIIGIGPRAQHIEQPEPAASIAAEPRRCVPGASAPVPNLYQLDGRDLALPNPLGSNTLQNMRAGLLRHLIRFLTWCSVTLLAFLSLLPAEEMARTGFPGELEHFVAYAGSAAIAMAGYGRNGSRLLIVGGFWLYAGLLEYLQHFSPGRHPAFLDFAASALGALCGALAAFLFWRRRPGLV